MAMTLGMFAVFSLGIVVGFSVGLNAGRWI